MGVGVSCPRPQDGDIARGSKTEFKKRFLLSLSQIKLRQGRLSFSFASLVFLNMVLYVKIKSEGTFVL